MLENPRRAKAWRTGNAGTGPLFLGARTCPFPVAEEYAAACRDLAEGNAVRSGLAKMGVICKLLKIQSLTQHGHSEESVLAVCQR